jgi:hypothetical protein
MGPNKLRVVGMSEQRFHDNWGIALSRYKS